MTGITTIRFAHPPSLINLSKMIYWSIHDKVYNLMKSLKVACLWISPINSPLLCVAIFFDRLLSKCWCVCQVSHCSSLSSRSSFNHVCLHFGKQIQCSIKKRKNLSGWSVFSCEIWCIFLKKGNTQCLWLVDLFFYLSVDLLI